MKLIPTMAKGNARLAGLDHEELRCWAPREDKPGWTCRKLIAKRNAGGQIAGNFRCERCGQEIEVKLIVPEALRPQTRSERVKS